MQDMSHSPHSPHSTTRWRNHTEHLETDHDGGVEGETDEMTYPLHEYDTDEEEDDDEEDMDDDHGGNDDDDGDDENERRNRHPHHSLQNNATSSQDDPHTTKPPKLPLSLRSPHAIAPKTSKGGKGSPRKSPGSPLGGGRSGDQILFTQREILALRLMFSLFDRSGLVSEGVE